MMRRPNDSVLLLTLVDLLVQIIFFALFVGVIHVSRQIEDESRYKDIRSKNAEVIIEVGIMKVAEIINNMTKLVPIDQIVELSVLLPEFKNIDTLKAALELAKAANFDTKIIIDQKDEVQKKVAKGSGLPACLVGIDDKKYLLRFEGYSDHYVMSVVTKEGDDLFQKLKIFYKQGDTLTREALIEVGKNIIANEPGCRYRVIYEPKVDSLKSFSLITRFFYPSIRQVN